MELPQESENNNIEYYEDNDKEEFFTNVFSHIGKFEKNRRYQQMQNGLNSLQQNVKLLEEFSNKDKLSNKRKFFSKKLNMLNLDKENNIKKLNARNRNNLILRKKNSVLKIDSNSMNNINVNTMPNEKNINRNIYKNINNKGAKIVNSRTNDLSMQKYKINYNKIKNKLLYKTEVKNYNQLINGEKLPNIYLSSDKRSETNMGSKNSNTNSTSRLPLIYDKKKVSSQKIYLFKDNNETDNNISINDNSSNRNLVYKKIPLIRKNLKDNSIIKKYPYILDSKRVNSYSLNHQILPQHTDKIVRIMKEKNVKIKNRIKNKLNEQDLIDWEMKSRLKLANWKYGIAEVQKYFIDLQAYGKPEEEELLKRKTFYDYVDDLIGEIKKSKEEKDIKSIEDKYISPADKNKFGNVKKKDEKKDKDVDNDLNAVDNTVNKQVELCEILEKVKVRRKKEKERSHLIDIILLRSEMRRKAINDSTHKKTDKRKDLSKSLESDINEESKISNKDGKNDESKNDTKNNETNKK